MSTEQTIPFRLAALLLLAASPALAQTARFDVAPRAGLYAPMNDLGGVAAAGGPWVLELERMKPAASLELSARLAWPAKWLATRVAGLMTLPTDVAGQFTCAPGVACPSILLVTDEAETSILAAVADAVFSPFPSDRAVRPFAVLGAGLKRYRFSWPDPIDNALMSAGSHVENAFALHGGIGLEFDVLGSMFRIEAGDYWSARGPEVAPGSGAFLSDAPRRNAQHDIGITIAWRALAF